MAVSRTFTAVLQNHLRDSLSDRTMKPTETVHRCSHTFMSYSIVNIDPFLLLLICFKIVLSYRLSYVLIEGNFIDYPRLL